MCLGARAAGEAKDKVVCACRGSSLLHGCRLKGRVGPGHHLEGKEQLAVGCMAAWAYAGACEEGNSLGQG